MTPTALVMFEYSSDFALRTAFGGTPRYQSSVSQPTTYTVIRLTLDTEDYVDKPVAPEELLKRVERLLK